MKKNLSILIYSLASGGAERVVSTLLKELNHKYNTTLILMNETIFYTVPKEIPIIYLEKSNPKESGMKKFLKLPLLAWRYNNICKEKDIEVSFSFTNRPNYINILSKFLGSKVKIIISERAMPSLQHKSGLQGAINRFLIKFLYPYADIITANSLGNSLDLEKNFGIKDIQTINNPYNIKDIVYKSKVKAFIKKDKFVFITIGRLDRGKNHLLILEAMKSIDAYLYVIGDGLLKEELDSYIYQNNLTKKVFLLGRQENPYSFLSCADCFVFASNHEGFPNVLIEALVCGLPVISTDCQSGPREILSLNKEGCLKDKIEVAEYGVLTPIQNKIKLLEAMNLIHENQSLKKEYSKKSIVRGGDFDVSSIIKQFEVVIDR